MPFGGTTSFGAMAHHIPDEGSCLVCFAPHVGIDHDGKIGSVNRRGRAAPGACCGSACAACNHVLSVDKGEADPVDARIFEDAIEMQQEPMVDLPLSLYEIQKKMMDDILGKASGEDAGEGKIALMGGVQINTPPDETDYLLPLSFEIRSNKNETMKDLMWS